MPGIRQGAAGVVVCERLAHAGDHLVGEVGLVGEAEPHRGLEALRGS